LKFASAETTVQSLLPALNQMCEQAGGQMGDTRPDLVLVFFTSHFEDEAETIVQQLVRRYPTAMLLGCSAEGVIGRAVEHERIPAISLMLASLPQVQLKPFHISTEKIAALGAGQNFADCIDVNPADHPSFLFFGDPFSVPMPGILNLFNRTYSQRPVLGGMASGCERPGQSVLILDDQIYREGAVGIGIVGPVDIHAVVSQGCRPIGHPLVITQCDRNIILQLGGKPALAQLHDILEELSPEDSQLARQALFVGRVINEYKETFTRGDFLIRNLFGIDPSSGAIAVGEEMRVGSTVQFHVRDGECADEDLRQMLSDYGGANAPAGVLLFSCNGRGTRMWSAAHHDAGVIRETCGTVPVTGFFAAGEIGPIGGKNFIHGHTASMALFCKQIEAADKRG
jgi:small ligand-binding sensory domain FIST